MKKRASASTDTWQRIRSAAKKVIRRRGIDAGSISEIVRVAGLTTGAAYGRFESRDDLLLHVWDEDAGAAILERLGRRLRDWRDSTSPRLSPAKLNDAEEFGLQMMAVAGRHQYFAETVREDFSRFLNKYAAVREDGQIRAGETLILALELARICYQGVREDTEEWSLATQVFDDVARRVDTVLTQQAQWSSSGNDITEGRGSDLVQSCRRVVSQVGLEHATLSRIARGAGFTTGSIFAQFDTREEFLRTAIAQLFAGAATQIDRRIVESQGRALLSVALGDLLMVSQNPARREWNAFRTECFLGARSGSFVRSTMRSVLGAGRQRYEELLMPLTGFRHEYLGGVTVVGQALPVGLTILNSLNPTVARLAQIESVDLLLKKIGVD